MSSPYLVHITGELDEGHSYDWITDRIAIGDKSSSYKVFNVVVNLNFPNNCVEYHSIGTVKDGDLTIYAIGMKDEEFESDMLSHVMNQLVPLLNQVFLEQPESRFLFHCRAGISRSVSMALALMMETTHESLQDALDQIQTIRPIAHPNLGFMNALMERYV
jgi:protein-tyrosine phosphatase